MKTVRKWLALVLATGDPIDPSRGEISDILDNFFDRVLKSVP